MPIPWLRPAHQRQVLRHSVLDTRPALKRRVAPLVAIAGDTRVVLSANLAQRLDAMQRDTSRQDWPAFNVSRRQAYDILVKMREEGKIGP